MREFRKLALALVAVVAWGTTARPAEKMVPEEGAVEVMLLRQKSVQDDLKLTTEEVRKIHEFADGQWKKAQTAESMNSEERNKHFQQLTEENHKFVHEVLEPAQRKRFHQITLQVAGLMCVTRRHVASELKLTDEQKTRAKDYQKEAREEMRELIHSRSVVNEQEKLAELRATSRKRLMELLTDEQEKTWAEMKGEPFNGTISFLDAK